MIIIVDLNATGKPAKHRRIQKQLRTTNARIPTSEPKIPRRPNASKLTRNSTTILRLSIQTRSLQTFCFSIKTIQMLITIR